MFPRHAPVFDTSKPFGDTSRLRQIPSENGERREIGRILSSCARVRWTRAIVPCARRGSLRLFTRSLRD